MSDPKSPKEQLDSTDEPLAIDESDNQTQQDDSTAAEQSAPEAGTESDDPTVQTEATEQSEDAGSSSDTSGSEDENELTEETAESLETVDSESASDNDAADPAAHDDVDLGDTEPDVDSSDEENGDPYAGHEHEALKRILESALFASGATLSVNHLRDMFEPYERPQGKIVRQLMTELIALYEGRGVQLVEVASGYRFQTDPQTATWVSRLWDEKPQRYSRALMETISLIAYRQPITRGEIEDVRGVAVSSNIIRTLLEREWVRVVGHRDVPGRPAMYATTRQFLDYFGLKSLEQLPSLSEIRDMDDLNPQMPLEEGEVAVEDDSQSEISFSGMIDKLRETEGSGKTGNDYIDDQLDGELAAMDDVNKTFEQSLEQQRAEHEHPDLNFTDDDEAESSDDKTVTMNTEAEPVPDTGTNEESESEPAEENVLSEEEQWKIIQEKLAQQQALLEARESDPQSEDENDE